MNIKRVSGIIGTVVGVILIVSAKKTLTGGAVGSSELSILSLIGSFMIIIGLIVILTSREHYESRLREMLGEKYTTLSSEEKHAYVKSYRRSEERKEKEREHKEGLEKQIVKTAQFEKSIRGHDVKAIDGAIEKITSGKGREEVLKGHGELAEYGPGLRSIRVTKGARILFKRHGKGDIVLIDYLPQHYS